MQSSSIRGYPSFVIAALTKNVVLAKDASNVQWLPLMSCESPAQASQTYVVACIQPAPATRVKQEITVLKRCTSAVTYLLAMERFNDDNPLATLGGLRFQL